ncbi:CRISPR-associated protein Cas1-3 [Methanobrevibacter ruminantium M1]|nr:CRISPR-associated protein Cas1-3 [Methanobrevibacter ruminantium M1]
MEEFRQQLVDKVVFSLVNTKQISNDDLDKRNNSISLDVRKLIIGRVLDKVNSNINYEGENLSYAQIIDKQAKKIVNYLINGEKYTGFSLRW